MTAVIQTINPATGCLIQTYEPMTPRQLDDAMDEAVRAQRSWTLSSFDDRAKILHSAAAELRVRKADLAELVTAEMGKPLRESLAEVEKCALGLEYYATNAAAFLRNEPHVSSADVSWVSFEPIGVVLAIMPWNFPLWQVFRFAAPALMAGNAALLKHSPNTTGSALQAQAILQASGLPPGLFTALLVAEPDVPVTTQALIADARVAAVTITGSERAGSSVASIAGREIKKSVLELGGSDPFVVLADADTAAVATKAVQARFLNAGQSCISPKRFIVEDSVADEFVAHLARGIQALTMGDPLLPGTDVGPMAREDLRDQVAQQVADSVAAGARLLAGGEVATDRAGYFYRPTLLDRVGPGMPAYDQEMFGPVASVIRVPDQDSAIEVANDTRFGLGASVWGYDVENAVNVGKQIVSGACFINAPVASDPALPFGGTKRSGYGRELACAGIREFVNLRTWYQMTHPDPAPTLSE